MPQGNKVVAPRHAKNEGVGFNLRGGGWESNSQEKVLRNTSMAP